MARNLLAHVFLGNLCQYKCSVYSQNGIAGPKDMYFQHQQIVWDSFPQILLQNCAVTISIWVFHSPNSTICCCLLILALLVGLQWHHIVLWFGFIWCWKWLIKFLCLFRICLSALMKYVSNSQPFIYWVFFCLLHQSCLLYSGSL